MIVSVKDATKLVQSGNVVGLPTETVYGLAADTSNIRAVRKIFVLKQRPADNPLIVHVSSADQVEDLADADNEDFRRLAKAFWPGPLTLVLPKKPLVLDIITAGLDTVALRMPDHPKMLSVIENTGPLAAPSANRSGKPSPTRPEHVEDDFGEDFPVVDGGSCSVGIESTVLDLSGDTPVILRPGQVTADQIEAIIQKRVEQQSSDQDQIRRSPGTRYSHYKPNASVHWMASGDTTQSHQPDTLYIYHTIEPNNKNENIIWFSGNYGEFAKSLYDLYRTADKKNYDYIKIEPFDNIPDSTIIPALVNRIQRSVSI